MPRIPPQVLRHAYYTEPLLAQLLPVCRTFASANNELRWLREHVQQDQTCLPSRHRQALKALVERRARGEPLQYILGSEHFGDLEIVCKPGVLIPRQETAASVSHLVRLLPSLLRLPTSTPLRVLDLCTGTGCIPLLFHHEFYAQAIHKRHQLDLQVMQIPFSNDTNDQAGAALRQLQFVKADVLQSKDSGQRTTPSIEQVLQQVSEEHRKFQIVISNPPYISTHEHKTVTSPSVRKYEPRLALVPIAAHHDNGIEDGNQFYPRLWRLADAVAAKVVLFEVGDLRQAVRVADMAGAGSKWERIEIWRDDPGHPSDNAALARGRDGSYSIKGDGNARSVVAWR
ncbi:hypothetical protein AMS68_007653 [Peltaster fructicola]|uniref:Release factor glutamine methyltransferase N-terminal domain-containing protein n=1 Tax=Peltaster fructicola TaxID=286661 RepID=A0A6H0Y597_9PEZI|nr:hypothetical protein AMS68_007653 [Peltaster fructicola]